MASVRESRGRLFLDYRAGGKRQRTYVKLPDTPANRQILSGVSKKVDATLAAGEDVLALLSSLGLLEADQDFNAGVFSAPPQSLRPTAAAVPSTPSFATFADQWFGEFKVGWRKTYITTVRGIIDQHLLPRFGARWSARSAAPRCSSCARIWPACAAGDPARNCRRRASTPSC